jgi:glycosyltransferase involved in cell wall biosynthesis
MSLNILQINTSDKGGGAEGSALNLHHQYRIRGDNSSIAVGKKNNDDNDIYQIDTKFPTFIRSLYLKNRLRTLFDKEKFKCWKDGIEDFIFPETYKLIKKSKFIPDIIHCHNLHGWYFDLRILPELSHTYPVILNLRDAWLLTGHCSHYFDCMRWQTGCGDCPYLSTYPAIRKDSSAYNWHRKKKIYSKTKAYIVTNSKWLMDCVDKSMVKGKKHRVIYNGIDLNIFKPGDKSQARRILGLPEKSSIIMFAANMAQNNIFKDYKTISNVIELLSIQNPAENILFLCLGAEKKKIVEGKYYYEPFVSDQKILAEYYRAADVFIHAAHAESFGKTITEAMACGTPVVATAVGGIPEQINDGINGFLVPHMDVNQMFYKTSEILRRKEMRESFVYESLKRVSYFSLERQAEEFLNYYNEIIEDFKSEKANIKKPVNYLKIMEDK